MGPKLYHKVTIFFGPHVANFLAKPSSNFFHYACFTCYRIATWNLHFFCDTLLHPSMWITLVYPSLHVSEFTSPSSTFICHLAFVHPPWASSLIMPTSSWGRTSTRCCLPWAVQDSWAQSPLDRQVSFQRLIQLVLHLHVLPWYSLKYILVSTTVCR